MTTPPQPAASKPEAMNIILKLILLIMVVVPATVCYVFFFGKLWGPIALTANLVLLPFLMWLLRHRRKRIEAETLRRIDKAMGKPSDDPRQMARFMR